MSNRSSIHFLQLNQREQHLVLNNLSRDFRRKELFNHYLTLYNIKKKALTGHIRHSNHKLKCAHRHNHARSRIRIRLKCAHSPNLYPAVMTATNLI